MTMKEQNISKYFTETGVGYLTLAKNSLGNKKSMKQNLLQRESKEVDVIQ